MFLRIIEWLLLLPEIFNLLNCFDNESLFQIFVNDYHDFAWIIVLQKKTIAVDLQKGELFKNIPDTFQKR